MCGTDLELIDGTIDPAYVRYPLILGHEWVGELLDDVPGVATRRIAWSSKASYPAGSVRSASSGRPIAA